MVDRLCRRCRPIAWHRQYGLYKVFVDDASGCPVEVDNPLAGEFYRYRPCHLHADSLAAVTAGKACKSAMVGGDKAFKHSQGVFYLLKEVVQGEMW